MSGPNGRSVRRHKLRTDDGKGVRRLIAGKRFRTPAGVSTREADQRFSRIEDLRRDNETFCRRIGRDPEWTGIATWAANSLRKGELRVPVTTICNAIATDLKTGQLPPPPANIISDG